MTQATLSEASGIAQANLCRILTGKRDLRMSELGRLCKAIGVTPEWLLRPRKRK